MCPACRPREGDGAVADRLVERAHALGADVDIHGSTVNATEGLKDKLMSVFGWTEAQGYAHIGVSGMNNSSDTGEVTTPIRTQIRDCATPPGTGILPWSGQLIGNG
ncbi:hypothetical protein ACSLFT_26750 [Streptomyces sp. G6]|uniref:hypothetical protein n=1 Tax=unclassified Streptomyces TaxID=2593676 RepID=UPI0037B0218D